MDNPTVLYNKLTKTLVNGVDIGRVAKYTAISHTWSMWDNISKDILGIHEDSPCEGTANFNKMVDFVNTEWVWIDTMCISESNKVTEIPQMRRYYKNAQVVLVVLDTSQGDYDLRVLEVNDNLEYRMGSSERMRLLSSSPERINEECALSEAGLMVYNTLCKMFKAQWFKRGWTLQELLLGKDIIIWNGNTSVNVTDVRKCLDWLGTLLPDYALNGLEVDDDYRAMEKIFHVDSDGIPFELVYVLMDGRKCTIEEDYIYCILGLLGIEMKIEYGINLHVCKKRLFTRLVQEQKAASAFTHTGNGIFPMHEYCDTSFNPDDPRSDRVVYSLARNGVKFAGCSVYVYEVLDVFRTDSFTIDDPVRNLWAITKMMRDDLYGYKDLVRAMYSITGTDDDELITTKSQWLLEMADLSATADSSFDEVPLGFDCMLLHSLLTRPQTPFVAYGMVHNNVSVCAYVFACLEDVPKDGKCMLLAPGIVGEARETGILCSGLNLRKYKQQKIGATLNLKKDDLGSIEPVANLLEVVVNNKKFRKRHSVETS